MFLYYPATPNTDTPLVPLSTPSQWHSSYLTAHIVLQDTPSSLLHQPNHSPFMDVYVEF